MAESLTATVVINLEFPPAAMPVISPASGRYAGAIKVPVKSKTPGTKLWVTTDGSTPGSGGMTLRSGDTIWLTESGTVKGVAVGDRKGYSPSPVATAVHTIVPSSKTAAKPVISPAAGAYDYDKKIKITCPQRKTLITYGTSVTGTPATPGEEYKRPDRWRMDGAVS